jgi:hypothetical protein
VALQPAGRFLPKEEVPLQPAGRFLPKEEAPLQTAGRFLPKEEAPLQPEGQLISSLGVIGVEDFSPNSLLVFVSPIKS